MAVRIRLCTQRFGDQGSVTVSCGPDVGHLGEGELESVWSGHLGSFPLSGLEEL